jgi:hypothetical protein
LNLSTNGYVQGFCAARGGGFWVACNGGIRKWKDGKWVADLGAAPWGWNIVASFMETSSGVLAGGTSDSGLWLVFPDQTNTPRCTLTRTNGLPSDWVISLWEDREKNLWCGTGAGLVVIRPSNLETVSPPDKWKAVPCSPCCRRRTARCGSAPKARACIACKTATGRISIRRRASAIPTSGRSPRTATGKSGPAPGAADCSSRRTMRLILRRGWKIFSRRCRRFYLWDGLWIGTPAGALRYQDGKLERFSEIAGEPFGDVRAIARDKSGALWFGTAGGGLVRRENGNFRRFKKSDGLSSDFIECLHFADDGALWIGTFGGGLNRFKDGKFSVINREQGLPNGVIGHIESDGRGFFWMSSYGGILRANETDLNRCADGKLAEVSFLTYGINDGLPTLECSEGLQSAGAKRRTDGCGFRRRRDSSWWTRRAPKSIRCRRRCGSRKCAWTTKNSRTATLPGR